MENKIISVLTRTFSFAAIVYFLVAAFYYLTRSGLIGGDEALFIRDLHVIREEGWIHAVIKNVSIPYMLLSYPFTFFLDNYVALRLVNVILLICFFLYLKFYGGIKNKLLFPYLFFYIAAVALFFLGTNDTLFILALSIFLNEAYKASTGEKFHFSIAMSCLVISIFTRELFLVYLPVILLGLFFIQKKGINKSKNNIFPLILFLSLLILNLPSIITNQRISYDRKDPPKGVEATWPQRQYLAQLMVNEGTLNFHQHPSWEETEAYLEKNGRNSLPKGIMGGITHDISLTIKEFFKDLFYISIYHTRTLCLFLISIIWITLINFWAKGRAHKNLFVPISAILMILIFSLIIISYVELRWLTPIFLLSIFAYAHLEESGKIPKYLQIPNLLLLLILTFYGTYGLVLKNFYII